MKPFSIKFICITIVLLAIQQTLDENTELLKKIQIENNAASSLTKESFQLAKSNLNRHTNIVIKYVKSYFDSLNKNQLLISEKFKEVNLDTTSNNNSTSYFIAIAILFAISLSAIIYANQLSKEIIKKENTAYKKGIETATNHINKFFKNNYKSKMAYDKWKNK